MLVARFAPTSASMMRPTPPAPAVAAGGRQVRVSIIQNRLGAVRGNGAGLGHVTCGGDDPRAESTAICTASRAAVPPAPWIRTVSPSTGPSLSTA